MLVVDNRRGIVCGEAAVVGRGKDRARELGVGDAAAGTDNGFAAADE